MPKKRRKAKVRTIYRRAKKAYRRAGKKSMSVFGVNVMSDLLYPGAYGAIRPDIAKFVIPYADKVPVLNQMGENKDEVALIVTAALASKFLGRKVPLVREIARQGIRIEAAQIGQNLRLGMGNSSVSSGSNSFR